MATISENLQTIKNSTDAIKQAIIDKGGTIEGDITTWAGAISGIESGGEPELLKFTINNGEHLFKNGMTWQDYVNSIYNIKGTHFSKLYIENNMICSTNLVYSVPYRIDDQSGVPQVMSNTITPNGIYTFAQQGSGGTN
jgi:hypothetical protein